MDGKAGLKRSWKRGLTLGIDRTSAFVPIVLIKINLNAIRYQVRAIMGGDFDTMTFNQLHKIAKIQVLIVERKKDRRLFAIEDWTIIKKVTRDTLFHGEKFSSVFQGVARNRGGKKGVEGKRNDPVTLINRLILMSQFMPQSR